MERIDVLAQEGDLAHALGGKAARFEDNIVHPAGNFGPARIGHNTEGAELVTAFLYGNKGCWPVSFPRLGQGIKLFDGIEFGFQTVADRAAGARDHFRQFVVGLRAKHEVNSRLAADKLLAFSLRHAAGHSNRHSPAGGFLPALQLAKLGIDLFGGLLADMAGIHDNEVCRLRRFHGRIAEGPQHITDALGVVHVHLAAIGPDKQALQALFVGGAGHLAAYASKAGKLKEPSSTQHALQQL